jgi:hypothetical protein
MRGAIPLVCVSVTLALAAACTLNPQPLPPDQPPDQAGAGGSAGSGGTAGTEPADAATNRADASFGDAGHMLPPVVEAGADSTEEGPAEAAVDGSGDAVSECGDALSEGAGAWDAWSPRD